MENAQTMFPRKFGRYVLVDRLFESAMSELFLGVLDNGEGLHRIAVIKKPHSDAGADISRSFEREIRVGMTLVHPNIVHVFEKGDEGAQPYIAMEWIRGRSVKQLIQRCEELHQTMPLRVASTIIWNVAKALSYAHGFQDPITGKRRPILHRDLSPHNIMVSYAGEVKLVDFGIAKILSENEQTVTLTVKGKPSYLSPEQIACTRLDHKTDIFSLGAIFFELLTGSKLFQGGNNVVTMAKISACDQFCPPMLESSAIPAPLKAVLTSCLKQNASERASSADEVIKELETVFRAERLCSNEEIAQFMRQHFQEEIEAENRKYAELFETLQGASQPPRAPIFAPEPAAEVPTELPVEFFEDLALDLPPEDVKPPVRPLTKAPPARPPLRVRLEAPPPILQKPEKEKPQRAGAPFSRVKRPIILAFITVAAISAYFALRDAGEETPRASTAQIVKKRRVMFHVNPQGAGAEAYFLNGKPERLTAGAIEIPAGERAELTILKIGFKPYKWTVSPTASEDAEDIVKFVNLEPMTYGTVAFESMPGVEVTISDDRLSWAFARTPEKVALPPGSYVVRLRRVAEPSWKKSIILNVTEGGLFPISPEPGKN